MCPSLSPATTRIGANSKLQGKLRIYRCVPGRLPALLSRFQNRTLRIWEKHGIRQAGFVNRRSIAHRPKTAIFFAEHDNFLFLFPEPHAGAAAFGRMNIVR